MNSKRSAWPFRLAVLGLALTGFAALTASSEPRAPSIEEAQKRASALVREAAGMKSKPRAIPAVSTGRPVAGRVAAASGAIQCQCVRWSQSSFWNQQVCRDERCWDRGPRAGECRCFKWETVNYEAQGCEAWAPNFCNFN